MLPGISYPYNKDIKQGRCWLSFRNSVDYEL